MSIELLLRDVQLLNAICGNNIEGDTNGTTSSAPQSIPRTSTPIAPEPFNYEVLYADDEYSSFFANHGVDSKAALVPEQLDTVVKGLINQDTSEDESIREKSSDVEDDEEVVPVQEDEEVKIDEMHTTLETSIKNVLVCLIGEYLNEVITLRQFLTKARQCLCSDNNASNKEVFTWILRCMLESGNASGNQVHRMATFLEEHGIQKQEIEASSAAIKEDHVAAYTGFEPEVGEKRKKREKKSISRGLRSAPNKWSKAESQLLIRLVHEHGDKSWKRIAEQLGGGKTGAQCAQHWKRVLSPQIRKGSWDDQEEELLLALVERYGQSWKNIAGEIKTRTDIQCRYQYQKSCLSRQCAWQEQEDALLSKKVAQMLHEGGGVARANPAAAAGVVAWVDVAKFIARAKLTKIPRTALECKQRWCARNNGQMNTYNIPPIPINNNNSIILPNNNNINNNIINNTHNNNISHQFHNISYSNINNNFTMAPSPYAAVTPTF